MQNLLRTARKASMRVAKRQLDACSHQSTVTRPNPESETGQFLRCAIEVRVLFHDIGFNSGL